MQINNNIFLVHLNFIEDTLLLATYVLRAQKAIVLFEGNEGHARNLFQPKNN